MTFDTKNNSGILIKKAARLFEQAANKNLKQVGATYAQTTFLVRLWETDGQTQLELARSAGLKQPTVVRTLERMERDNLISRQRNEKDRRIINFYLTKHGKAVCRKLASYAGEMNEIAIVNLKQKEAEVLNKLISQVIDNLQVFLDK